MQLSGRPEVFPTYCTEADLWLYSRFGEAVEVQILALEV